MHPTQASCCLPAIFALLCGPETGKPSSSAGDPVPSQYQNHQISGAGREAGRLGHRMRPENHAFAEGDPRRINLPPFPRKTLNASRPGKPPRLS